MAIPSSNNSKSLQQIFAEMAAKAAHVKQLATSLNDASAIGDVQGKAVIDLSTIIADAILIFQATQAAPGIDQFAKDQMNTPALNIGNELTATITACINVRDWIVTNYPNTAGSLDVMSFDIDGRFINKLRTSAELADLRPLLDALILTID